MDEFIKKRLEKQKSAHRYRQRTLLTIGNSEQQSDANISVKGKTYLNFSSNDYLGLNQHPKINKAMQEGVDKYGLCSTGSSLITGYHYAHSALEALICEWLNKPKCLLFNSGFSANCGVFQALGEKHSHFYLDKLSHASIIDGAYTSNAQVKRFLHNDLTQLTRFIDKAQQSNHQSDQQDSHLIVSEGVFSMDGDSAKVKQLALLAKSKDAKLYLDDAHSIGVLGMQGKGSSSQENIDIVMATFGKAIATSGAFVACDDLLFDYLVNFSRHYIYSTAMSPALAWATKASIELIKIEQWRRDKIIELSNIFRSKLEPHVALLPSHSSIHAIIIGSEEKTLKASAMLKERGIWLSAIRPPTVANKQSRLRVTICANHKTSDINYLAKQLNKIINN